ALLYAMLTGKPPRDDVTLRAALQSTAKLAHRLAVYREKIREATRPTLRRIPGIDRDLAQLIDRCLDLDPNERPRDAGDVLRLLQRRDKRRRQRMILASAVLAPLVLVLLMG